MIFKTTYQKQSAVITFVLTAILLFFMFFCGLRNIETPEEYGVAINFGTSDFGSGEPTLNKTIESSPVENKIEEQQNKVVENTPEVKEKILNQNIEEAPVVENKKEPTKIVPKVEKKKIEKKKIVKKVEKVVPKPTKQTQNVLNNLFGKKSKGETAKSEGDDANGEGVKGALEGDPKSDKYYGNNGSGGDGNYLLKGRRALSKPIRKPDCNEEGVVVVRIEVDNTGKVIKATPGVKGTTNNSPCLLAPAKKAALSTKWNPDGNAPNKQVGLIRYKFILSE